MVEPLRPKGRLGSEAQRHTLRVHRRRSHPQERHPPTSQPCPQESPCPPPPCVLEGR
ncbi:unnamed protein product [Linum tenue]|uniref:Uncharacterized protein n=1 Tax=Linum tenue TaxID=586396 RepID=A0AAV0RET6_9ROSI|nr:unnamed protein product [Linum tenue]